MRDALSAERVNCDEFYARSRQLVAGTCVGIGQGHIGIHENIYDFVIIDEAARSISSELAIAMQSAKRVLLVGDTLKLFDSKSNVINLQFLDDLLRLESNNPKGRSTFLGPIYSHANWSLLQRKLAPALKSRIENKANVGQPFNECMSSVRIGIKLLFPQLDSLDVVRPRDRQVDGR
jgi:hypothetical protein